MSKFTTRKHKLYISFDCAYKSLAYSVLYLRRFTAREILDMTRLIDKSSPDAFIRDFGALLDMLNESIRIVAIVTADVLDGQKVEDLSEMSRTFALFNFLQSRQFPIIDANTAVRIEYQPPRLIGGQTNAMSTYVSKQIAHHFIMLGSRDMKFVSPKLKQRVCLGAGLDIETFLARHKDKYRANKEHSKANFLRLLEILGLSVGQFSISHDMLDDAADSLLQIFADLWYGK